MFCVASCTSGVLSLLESSCSFASASGPGVSPLARSTALQRVRDLTEVRREHLVVVPDLLGHLVRDLLEHLVGGVEIGARPRERLRELRGEPGELGALSAERGRAVVGLGHLGAVVLGRPGRLLDDGRLRGGRRVLPVVTAATGSD